MTLLPNLGESVDTADWTDYQINSFAAFTYLVIGLYTFTVGLAIHNFIVFVIHGDRCRVMQPLFGFYVLSICCLLADIVLSIWLV